MELKEIYSNLPYDLAGSRTKNRFDFEVLYGIEQLIDNYNKIDNYYVVFDYVCDIELHYDNKLKFYQVKTSDTGKSNKVNFLTNKKSDNSQSIIGRIYSISGKTEEEKENISVLLVSNAPLVNNQYATKPNEIILLDQIDSGVKKKIIEHLQKETNQETINLKNIYYLYRNVGVQDFENSILGKLSKFYEEEKKSSINKPTVLLDSIKSIAINKAKYEKECNFEELYKNKSISKKEFTDMVNYHHSQHSDFHKKCEEQITNLTNDNFSLQIKCLKALTEIISGKDKKKNEFIDIICDTIRKDIELGYANSLKEYAINFKNNHQDIKFSIYDDESTIFTMVIYCVEKIKEEMK